jgi:hypothetical protein
MKTRLATFVALLIALPAAADETPAAPHRPAYVQVWLGGLSTDDDSWKITDPQSGDDALGDLGTLPFGGGAVQQLWGSGAWQIGYEGGGLVSWKSGGTDFRGTNNVVQVNIDSAFASIGVFMGGIVSVSPVRSVRLYAAAGPSVTWAWLDNDNGDNDVAPPPDGSTANDLDGTETDVSLTGYARAGVEFVLKDGFTFGFSVRYADDEFDFGDAGDLQFDEPMWLLTLGSRL